MDSAQYAELFLTESREHVSAINHSLLELERGEGGAEPVGAIFRSVHTIKGMSATMGYGPVASLSHELETLLDRVRQGKRTIDPPLMDLLFRSADVLEAAIEAAVGGDAARVDVEPLVAALKADSTQNGANGTALGIARAANASAPSIMPGAPMPSGPIARPPGPQSFCCGRPDALLMLPCTMKEFAELWLRSAISSLLMAPSFPRAAVSADWFTASR